MTNNSQSLKKIDQLIEYLTEDQLRQLNHKIVERLNIIWKARALKSMSNFNTLDKAYFIKDWMKISWTITRLNQKTVTLITEDWGHWNVTPHLLTKIIEA